MLDDVAPPQVQVHGAGVAEAEDAFALDGADDLPLARLDDGELLVARGAQADAGGGGVRPGPDQAVLATPQPAALGEPLGLQKTLLAEEGLVVGGQRTLVGGGLQVRPTDVRVVQVDDRLLDAASQEALRLAHEVLVERVLAGHQHGIAVPGPAGPAPALAQAGDRAGEAGDERDVQAADVDAQLERLRGDDGVELVGEQAPLDVAPLLRRVAGAVRLHAIGRAAGRGGPQAGGGRARTRAPPPCASARTRSRVNRPARTPR